MAKPDSALRQISKSCLHGLIILFCCPITCLLVTFTPKPNFNSNTYIAKMNRKIRRNTRIHSCIVICPAGNPAYIDLPSPDIDDYPSRHIYARSEDQGAKNWDPLLAHLVNQGNRLFAMRPTDGVLCSANVAGGGRGFRVQGSQLMGTLEKGKWKEFLDGMMKERDMVMDKESIGYGKWWKKTGGLNKKKPHGMETKWVEGVVGRVKGMMEKEGDLKQGQEKDDQEGGFEIWKVEIQTVGEIIQDEYWRGAGRGAEMLHGSYLWYTKVFTGGRLDLNSRPVEDLFPGSWAREYIDGDAEPFTVVYDEPWPRPITNDSGILAEVEGEQ
ncbi:hypothetical protein BZA77DRAFT_297581 [Pyronema omphalodes]|nr:hypothetical protein BZA77DRAFT_297581 [Pyronema omphalodes]